ncbi:MAG: hypothetical protein EBZ69_06830, partial [Alphaproteobacteria bacterium]|nr:hypothetical protein [Alphaproteobacteria bacterium]
MGSLIGASTTTIQGGTSGVAIRSAGTGNITFSTNGVNRWQITNSGALQYLQSTSISTPSVTGQGNFLSVSGGSGTTGGGSLSLSGGSSSGGVGGSVYISSGNGSGSFAGGYIILTAASRGGVNLTSGGAGYGGGATVTVQPAISGAGYDFGASIILTGGNVDYNSSAATRSGGAVSLQGGCLYDSAAESCVGGYGQVDINTNYGNVNIGSPTSAISVQGSTFAVGSLLGTNSSTNIVQLGSSNLSGTNRVQIGTGPTNSGNSIVTQLVVDTKGTAGDPSGVNGSIYYNGITQKMRCYEGGAWADCIPAGSSSVWRLNTATANTWTSIAYGGGVFVAIPSGGNTFMRSQDATNWSGVGVPTSATWTSVTYGNGMFVAVANSGPNRVMTSRDGISWSVPATSAIDKSWSSVTYGNGIFVAVANGGTGNRVMTSADGITWLLRSSPADSSWVSVTYGNGLFVAVNSGAIASVMVSGSALSVNTPTGNIYQGVQTFSQQLRVGYAGTATGQLYVAGNATNARRVGLMGLSGASVMQVQGKYLYESSSGYMRVVDISVPSNPTLVSNALITDVLVSMRLSGRY